MREIIAMGENFLTGEKFEEKKFKPDIFRNRITALLYNEDGELIGRHNTENIVHTKNLDLMLFYNTFSPQWVDHRGARFAPPMPASTYYLVLTDYAGMESAENLFLRGKMSAYAYRSTSTVTPDTTRGYLNIAETVKVNNFKYKLVFDFPQNTGNGTFQSVWLAENSNFITSLGGLFSINTGYPSNNYNTIITDVDGYWVADNHSLVKFDYRGIEVLGTRVNLNTLKDQSNNTHNNYNRLYHVSNAGNAYYDNSSYSDRMYKTNADRTATQWYSANFYGSFGTTYLNNKVYWLCYNTALNAYCLASKDVAEFEVCTDFRLSDSHFTKLLDLIKQKYPTYTSFSPTREVCNLSVFEGKLALSLYGTVSPGSTSLTKIFLIDPNTMQIVDEINSSTLTVRIGQASSFGFTSTTSNNGSEDWYYIQKFIGDGRACIACSSSGNCYICLIVPPFSHAKLPGPITKDNSQSLKIVYELEMVMPSGWCGNISGKG